MNFKYTMERQYFEAAEKLSENRWRLWRYRLQWQQGGVEFPQMTAWHWATEKNEDQTNAINGKKIPTIKLWCAKNQFHWTNGFKNYPPKCWLKRVMHGIYVHEYVELGELGTCRQKRPNKRKKIYWSDKNLLVIAFLSHKIYFIYIGGVCIHTQRKV